jgi:hypothetical protein
VALVDSVAETINEVREKFFSFIMEKDEAKKVRSCRTAGYTMAFRLLRGWVSAYNLTFEIYTSHHFILFSPINCRV